MDLQTRFALCLNLGCRKYHLSPRNSIKYVENIYLVMSNIFCGDCSSDVKIHFSLSYMVFQCLTEISVWKFWRWTLNKIIWCLSVEMFWFMYSVHHFVCGYCFILCLMFDGLKYCEGLTIIFYREFENMMRIVALHCGFGQPLAINLLVRRKKYCHSFFSNCLIRIPISNRCTRPNHSSQQKLHSLENVNVANAGMWHPKNVFEIPFP